jgi:hypothetical protein
MQLLQKHNKYGNLSMPPDTTMFVVGIPWNKVIFQTMIYLRFEVFTAVTMKNDVF